MTIGIWAFGFGLLLLVGALFFVFRSQQLQSQSGLPKGNVIYTDGGAWFPNEDPLYDRGLKLVGKPDYLIEQDNGDIIPVELKSGRAPTQPHDGHVLQLAAYCLLVEQNYGIRPYYGIIQYQDRAFAVDFTDDLEADLLDVLAEMRQDMFATAVDRDHEQWARCNHCGVRNQCDQSLVFKPLI